MAPVTHIVAFGFKDSVSAEAINKIAADFFQLKKTCVTFNEKKPYILSIKGGKDSSPEGLQNGVTHAFVVEFASEEDRDYYVKEDPAHKAFGQGLASSVASIVVTDFINGVY